jgi:hypothetical protein
MTGCGSSQHSGDPSCFGQESRLQVEAVGESAFQIDAEYMIAIVADRFGLNELDLAVDDADRNDQDDR